MTSMQYRARFTVPALAVLSLLLQAKVCRADDSEPPENLHRLSLVAGYTPLSYVGSAYQNDEARDDKEPTAQFRAGYAYRAYPALEVGGALTTVFTPFGPLLMPQGTLRGFITFTESPRLDAGLSARIGMLYAPHAADVGYALSGGLDVRMWPTRYLAISLGSSVGTAEGSSTNPGHELTYYQLGSIELGVTFAL